MRREGNESNVRYWHKADIRESSINVRYWGKADIGWSLNLGLN
jgi:hypothetical protein